MGRSRHVMVWFRLFEAVSAVLAVFELRAFGPETLAEVEESSQCLWMRPGSPADVQLVWVRKCY